MPRARELREALDAFRSARERLATVRLMYDPSQPRDDQGQWGEGGFGGGDDEVAKVVSKPALSKPERADFIKKEKAALRSAIDEHTKNPTTESAKKVADARDALKTKRAIAGAASPDDRAALEDRHETVKRYDSARDALRRAERYAPDVDYSSGGGLTPEQRAEVREHNEYMRELGDELIEAEDKAIKHLAKSNPEAAHEFISQQVDDAIDPSRLDELAADAMENHEGNAKKARRTMIRDHELQELGGYKDKLKKLARAQGLKGVDAKNEVTTRYKQKHDEVDEAVKSALERFSAPPEVDDAPDVDDVEMKETVDLPKVQARLERALPNRKVTAERKRQSSSAQTTLPISSASARLLAETLRGVSDDPEHS